MRTKTIDFSGQDIFIGLDVHKKSWSVTILTDDFEHRTFDQPPGADALETYLDRHFPGGVYHSAYEAGFCGYGHHRELHHLGIDNIVINPADVPTSGKDRSSKTDKVDSRKIAKALRAGLLTPVHVFDRDHEEFRKLSRTRFGLVKDRRRCKQRIKSLFNYFGIELADDMQDDQVSKKMIRYLKEYRILEHDAGEGSLEILIDAYQETEQRVLDCQHALEWYVKKTHQKTYDLLRTIPGIGPISAYTLIAEIGDMNRFASARRLASYVGLRPNSHSSGEHDRKGKITTRCNPFLRTIIVEASWMAMKHDTTLLAYYNRHAVKGETKRAAVKVAHKLLNRVRAVWLSGKPYELRTN